MALKASGQCSNAPTSEPSTRFPRSTFPRYVAEFAGRHNFREPDTLAQITQLVRPMEGKRLRYKDLVA